MDGRSVLMGQYFLDTLLCMNLYGPNFGIGTVCLPVDRAYLEAR